MTDLDPNRNSKAAGPQWHLHIPPETYGPYSLQQLRDYAREGRMNAETLVWSEGADGWGRAGDQAALKGLFAVTAPARAPAPPAPPVSTARAAASASPYVLGASGAVAVAGGGVMETVATTYVAPPASPRMGFAEAVRTCMRAKYFTFQGRAARAEFWWFALFVFIVLVVVEAIAGWIIAASISDGSISVGGYLAIALASLIGLVFAIPGLAVTVRRLHDLGYSGLWYLAQLIPVVGGIISIIMLIGFMKRGNIGDNKFGPDPLAGAF